MDDESVMSSDRERLEAMVREYKHLDKKKLNGYTMIV